MGLEEGGLETQWPASAVREGGDQPASTLILDFPGPQN